MVALNFKKQFAPAVESGSKRQTIRASDRKGQLRAGVKLQLYTGMRPPVKGACRKLVAVDPVCLSVEPVQLSDVFGGKIAGKTQYDLEAFARADGFETWAQMRDWFNETYGLPFTGVLIRW